MKSCIENKPVSFCNRRMRYLMNTFCSIQAEAQTGASVEDALEEAFAELKRIEGVFSRYAGDSEITKLNLGAFTCEVKLEAEVFFLIARALEFSRITLGAFDITVGAAVDFWRSCESEKNLPSQGQIEELKSGLGYQNIILNYGEGSVRFNKPGMKIDFGALAKGYALDRAAAILKERGVAQAQINLGGNIYVVNSQPQAIAIRNPIFPEEVAATVDLTEGAISTSANYERFFTIGDRRFGHLLNPLTGSPVKSDILSVSVICPDAALADALSTGIFVLGLKKGRKLLKGIQGVEAVIISKGIWGKKVKVYKMKGGNESESE